MTLAQARAVYRDTQVLRPLLDKGAYWSIVKDVRKTIQRSASNDPCAAALSTMRALAQHVPRVLPRSMERATRTAIVRCLLQGAAEDPARSIEAWTSAIERTEAAREQQFERWLRGPHAEEVRATLLLATLRLALMFRSESDASDALGESATAWQAAIASVESTLEQQFKPWLGHSDADDVLRILVIATVCLALSAPAFAEGDPNAALTESAKAWNVFLEALGDILKDNEEWNPARFALLGKGKIRVWSAQLAQVPPEQCVRPEIRVRSLVEQLFRELVVPLVPEAERAVAKKFKRGSIVLARDAVHAELVDMLEKLWVPRGTKKRRRPLYTLSSYSKRRYLKLLQYRKGPKKHPFKIPLPEPEAPPDEVAARREIAEIGRDHAPHDLGELATALLRAVAQLAALDAVCSVEAVPPRIWTPRGSTRGDALRAIARVEEQWHEHFSSSEPDRVEMKRVLDGLAFDIALLVRALDLSVLEKDRITRVQRTYLLTFASLGYDEAAKNLGVNAGALRQRVRAARERMKRELGIECMRTSQRVSALGHWLTALGATDGDSARCVRWLRRIVGPATERTR